jgi:hypothetical protein
VHYLIALAKRESNDVDGAVESARESVRVYSKLGISDAHSQLATKMLGELEGRGLNSVT